MYAQNYNPLGIGLLSTIAAAIPILTLLYFIALHPHRDASGNRHLGISAPRAAFAGVVAAFVIALIVMRMPPLAAVTAFIAGALNGAIGIVWIIVGAMLLYTMTLVSGKFEIVKESITHISFDRRLQCLLIAFSFGAIIEGTSGFGTPVAIAGAICRLVGPRGCREVRESSGPTRDVGVARPVHGDAAALAIIPEVGGIGEGGAGGVELRHEGDETAARGRLEGPRRRREVGGYGDARDVGAARTVHSDG